MESQAGETFAGILAAGFEQKTSLDESVWIGLRAQPVKLRAGGGRIGDGVQIVKDDRQG